MSYFRPKVSEKGLVHLRIPYGRKADLRKFQRLAQIAARLRQDLGKVIQIAGNCPAAAGSRSGIA